MGMGGERVGGKMSNFYFKEVESTFWGGGGESWVCESWITDWECLIL